MSRMAHMELAIKHNINVNLGDVILYVNNGTVASHGDVAVKNKNSDELVINCYLVNQDELDKNPDMVGDYNVPRAVKTFNKRIEPLLVVFKQEVRDGLIVNNPEDRGLFTTEQCELINGLPFDEADQDNLTEVLQLSEGEIEYWEKRGLDSNYIYDLAEEDWQSKITIA